MSHSRLTRESPVAVWRQGIAFPPCAEEPGSCHNPSGICAYSLEGCASEAFQANVVSPARNEVKADSSPHAPSILIQMTLTDVAFRRLARRPRPPPNHSSPFSAHCGHPAWLLCLPRSVSASRSKPLREERVIIIRLIDLLRYSQHSVTTVFLALHEPEPAFAASSTTLKRTLVFP